MPELIQTLKSIQKKESDSRKFLASIQGVTLEDDSEGNEGPSFEDIQRRAMGITASGNDIVSLQGSFASQAGFGIGVGLGYERG
jgi:hypothetical protein